MKMERFFGAFFRIIFAWKFYYFSSSWSICSEKLFSELFSRGTENGHPPFCWQLPIKKGGDRFPFRWMFGLILKQFFSVPRDIPWQRTPIFLLDNFRNFILKIQMVQQSSTFPNLEHLLLSSFNFHEAEVTNLDIFLGLKASKTVRVSFSGVDHRLSMISQPSWICSCADAFRQKNIGSFLGPFENFQADPSAHPNIHQIANPDKFWTYPHFFLWRGTRYPHPSLKVFSPFLLAPLIRWVFSKNLWCTRRNLSLQFQNYALSRSVLTFPFDRS